MNTSPHFIPNSLTESCRPARDQVMEFDPLLSVLYATIGNWTASSAVGHHQQPLGVDQVVHTDVS